MGIGTAAFIVIVIVATAAAFHLLLRFQRRGRAGIKGVEGERRVSRELHRIGFPHLDDVYLPTPDGATQVDHVVRAGNAIVVIETKSLSGAVYGTARDREWRQSFRRGQNTSFQNPVRQNHKHVLAVRAACGPEADVRPVVVMAGTAKFPKGMPEGVVSLKGLVQFLRETMASAGKVTTAEGAWKKLETVARAHIGRKGRALHQEALAAKA